MNVRGFAILPCLKLSKTRSKKRPSTISKTHSRTRSQRGSVMKQYSNDLKRRGKNNIERLNILKRDMETLFSKVKIAHGRRIFCNLDCEKKLLTLQDLDKGFESYLDNENKQNIEHERVMKQIRDTIYV